MKSIDIVVGGQFGDEGKGQICAYLVKDQMDQDKPYGFAVRVGGSNAEHRFMTPDGKRHTGRVLPVAGWVDPSIKMVLGAGHMIKLDSLLKEIKELTNLHGIQRDRAVSPRLLQRLIVGILAADELGERLLHRL